MNLLLDLSLLWINYHNIVIKWSIYILGITCAIGIICGIILLSKKHKLDNLINKLLLPTPKVPIFLINLLNKIVNNPDINHLLDFRTKIIDKFGALNNTPIYLIISDNFQVRSYNKSGYSTNNIKYVIDSKFSIIQIDIKNLNIIVLLNDLFNGYGFQTIIFDMDINTLQSQKNLIREACDFIYSITNIIYPVSILLRSSDMNLQTLPKIYQETDWIGLEIKNLSNIEEEYNNFLNNLIKHLMFNNSDNSIINDFIYLQKSKTDIMECIFECMKTSMSIRGVFFYTIDLINIKQQALFTENLFKYIFYNFCNEVKLNNNFIQNQKNKFLMYVKYCLFSVIGVYSVFLCQALFLRFKSVNHFINLYNKISKGQTIDQTYIMKSLSRLKTSKISLLSQILQKNPISNLQLLRNFLITYCDSLFNINIEIGAQNTFNCSPIDTPMFIHLKENIHIIANSMIELDSYMQNEQQQSVLSLRLKKYKKEAHEKILMQFEMFLNSFSQYLLLQHIEKLNTLISQNMNNNDIRYQNISQLIEYINEIKNIISLSSNSWWIQMNLGHNYYKLLKEDIKSIPGIGDDLYSEIMNMTEDRLKTIKSYILEFEHVLIGKLFVISSSNNGIASEIFQQIKLSPNFEELLKYLNIINSESVLQYDKNDDLYYNSPEQHQISLWKIDVLDDIIMKFNKRESLLNDFARYPETAKRIATNLLDNSLYNFTHNKLCIAQNVMINAMPLEEKTKNLSMAIEKLDIIKSFIVKHLNRPMFSWLDVLLQDALGKIVNEFREILNNSIFTLYTKLPGWNGSDVIGYLFQCNKSDIPFVISRNIEYLKNIQLTVLSPILPKLAEINNNDYKFIKYIFDEINAYNNGHRNEITMFENLIMSLRDWKIEYHEPIDKISNKERFFSFHVKFFETELINQTNKLVFNKSINQYNQLAEFFNDRLADRFPFGSKEDANIKDIIIFLNMYNAMRDHLVKDRNFMALTLPISIEYLDLLNQFFIVKNNELYINVKIQYHVQEGVRSNMNLIKFYKTKFHNQVFVSDTVEYAMLASEGFGLTINTSNTSVMKIIKQLPNDKTILDTNESFEFINSMGFIHFINKFLFKISNNNATIRIKIPIANPSFHLRDDIITYAIIFNYPFFFNKIELINKNVLQ